MDHMLIKDWDSVPPEMTTVAIALNCPMTCVRFFFSWETQCCAISTGQDWETAKNGI